MPQVNFWITWSVGCPPPPPPLYQSEEFNFIVLVHSHEICVHKSISVIRVAKGLYFETDLLIMYLFIYIYYFAKVFDFSQSTGILVTAVCKFVCL